MKIPFWYRIFIISHEYPEPGKLVTQDFILFFLEIEKENEARMVLVQYAYEILVYIFMAPTLSVLSSQQTSRSKRSFQCDT